ncbi:uncharacterized protein LOC118236024 isoform X1 [Anguilla anguilla]|uniref:uncharacterized protein LOC118236024 isoform X1 n=1 Tax=Anguilla anguilla TaxID=7936 RepID=UPI0015B191FF|nr:uncharacterized protein LOC118236024 isoform X1 [Anguilla anguilla]
MRRVTRCSEPDVVCTLQSQTNMANSNIQRSVRSGGAINKSNHFWTDEETLFMLNQIKKLDILKFIDGRKHRNVHMFKKVSNKMVEAGFVRTVEQIRCRWKSLKQSYCKAKSHNSTSGSDTVKCPYFDFLNEMLGRWHLAGTGDQGIDVCFDNKPVTAPEYSQPATPPTPSSSALNAQAAISQVRERQLAAHPLPLVSGTPPSDASPSVPGLPHPEHCEGVASGLRGPLPEQPNTTSSLPGPAPSLPTTAPPNQRSKSQVALPGHHSTTFCAEEAVLQKMRWASQELQHSASVEASIQLCNLIRCCADSLRSLRDLQFSSDF